MARPKMTDDEKAAAKAAREATKAGGETGGQPPKEAKEPKGKKSEVIFNSDFDQEEKALFLRHLPVIKQLRSSMATATANLRNAYKTAKAEGAFTKKDFDTAIAVETAENEAKERGRIARALKIAKIMGSSLGAQLDMFLEPDRTPAADIASEEGERDALQNLPARPKYDPSTEQHRKYMDSYHNVSERRIKEGMGTLHPEVVADEVEKARHQAERQAAQARDAAAFQEFDTESRQNGVDRNGEFDAEAAGKPADAEPSSGVPMTRAQFKAQQEAQKTAGTKH